MNDHEPTIIEVILKAFEIEGEIPEVLTDITDVSDDELMSTMVETVEWRNYVDTQVAGYRAEIRALETKIRRRRAELAVTVGGANADERRAQVERDRLLVALEDSMLAQKATLEMVEVLDGNLGRRIDKLYSREITRRTEMEPGRRRRDRMGG